MPFLFGGLFFLGPRASLIACATIPIVVALVAFAILNVEHVFIFPSAAIITCAIAYPIWSWRRQEALLRYLSLEAELVMNEPSLPDEPAATSTILDPVARRLTVMTTAAARMRRYRAFVSDWVDSLPEATLVASSSGAVVMANDRARALLRGGDGESGRHAPLTGRPVADVLHEMTSSHRTTVFVARALASFSRCQQEGTSFDSDETAMDQGVEIVDAQDRSLLIKCATIKSSPGREGALIFHIANLTSIRRAERQRDITLRFLSHDIRSPQAAILALVELKRQDPVDMPEGKFTELVAQYAASTLNLADDFLFLARAESQPPRLVKIDLALLVGDAVDDVWPHARAKHTTVRLAAEPGMIVLADALLLRRAFANLIGNAIKFSPDGATVTVEAAELPAAWKVSVIDKGVGISEVRIQELFKEFVRLDADPSRPGHGLGLAFVKSVIESLGGEVSVQSGVTIGSTFSVVLPKAVDA
jgi:signal transduction histidine kinase